MARILAGRIEHPLPLYQSGVITISASGDDGAGNPTPDEKFLKLQCFLYITQSAGSDGLEPPSYDLETKMLPIRHDPPKRQ